MAEAPATKFRSRLFTKYVALFVAVVAVALLSNGIFEVFFYYREHKAEHIAPPRYVPRPSAGGFAGGGSGARG